MSLPPLSVPARVAPTFAVNRTTGSSSPSITAVLCVALTSLRSLCAALISQSAARPALRSCWNVSWRARPVSRSSRRTRQSQQRPRNREKAIMPDRLSQAAVQSSSAPVTPRSGKCPLVPCVYIGLQCPFCAGDVRQALAELPPSPSVLCPQCGTSCSFIPLGSGSTRRALPFVEIPRLNAKLMFRSDEVPPDDAPAGFPQHPALGRSQVIASPSSQRAGFARRRSSKPFLSG